MTNIKHSKRRQSKLKKNEAHFLMKLSELLQNGFTQRDALIFLFEQYEVLKSVDKNMGKEMARNGSDLSEILLFLGYRNSVISQIKFADVHGEVIRNLDETSLYLIRRRETIKKILKAIQYPLILLSIFIIMLTILNYTVIPQFNSLFLSMNAEKSTMIIVLTKIIEILPIVALTVVALLCISLLLLTMILKQKDTLKVMKICYQIPYFKTYFKYYISYKFGREIGYLIKSGVELKDILEILRSQEFNPYLKIISEIIHTHVIEGNSFSDAVSKTYFLDSKIFAFIKHGEINSNVGKELLLYSEYTIENIIMKIERLTTRIQPIIFIVLGFLIICLYLVIVLPVFQMMSQLN